jgi:hypothetical protein
MTNNKDPTSAPSREYDCAHCRFIYDERTGLCSVCLAKFSTTSAPSRVLTKCRRYVDYYRTGAEQRQSGVFPLVVWVVPDEKRKNTLEQYIETEMGGVKALFQVKVCDEFPA